MPTCIVCKVIKTRLDNNNLCADCRTPRNAKDVNVNEYLNNLDTTKSLKELSIQELIDIMNAIMLPVVTKVDEISLKINTLDELVKGNGIKLQHLRHDVDNQEEKTTSLEAEITMLKKILVNQQTFIEQVQRSNIAKKYYDYRYP